MFFKNVISTKIIYLLFFPYKIFEIQCKYSTSQLRLVTFQVLSSHMQPALAYWTVHCHVVS